MLGTNNNIIIHEAINDDYEWIQYNERLRLIRSVKDDMYQMQSIINACNSTKHADDWFDNDSTKELLAEIERDVHHQELMSNFEAKMTDREYPVNWKPYENRIVGVSPKVKGYYVHRLLVNHVAMWCSPRYSWYIMKLLDDLYAQERQQLEHKIEKQEHKIEEQKPRMVPEKKERNYKYMIWKEEVPEDPDMILLHLVRRNNRVFSQVQKIADDPEKNWFYREGLPVAMTPNEDVKSIVRKTLAGSEYDIKACTILTYKEHLPLLHEKFTEYFDNFQQ